MGTITAKQRSYISGLHAEDIAALFLRLRGYRVLARRYKTPVGEIDIVASRGKILAFVEVKSRKNGKDALESVTPTMRRRIERAGLHFIGSHPQLTVKDIRFDLIALSWPFFIRHLDNAWRPAT